MTTRGLSESIRELMNNKVKYCIVGKFEQELDKRDADAFQELMQSNISHMRVALLLSQNDFIVGETAIWKHRSSRCSCARTK